MLVHILSNDRVMIMLLIHEHGVCYVSAVSLQIIINMKLHLNFVSDDYNIPIEIPMMVQNLTEQHLDIVPDFRADQVTEMQLLVTQRSFDCEQFVQRKAQKLCSEAQLEFLYCEDYDIKIANVSM